MKIPIYLDGKIFSIDFLEVEKYGLKEGNYYYLADSYKEPTRVKFIEWYFGPGIEHINIFCACSNNLRIGYYNPSSLFKTKEKASNEYLKRKEKKENE